MRPFPTHAARSVVSVSVLCTPARCAKTDEPIEMPFGVRTRENPRIHVLVGGLGPPQEGHLAVDTFKTCPQLIFLFARGNSDAFLDTDTLAACPLYYDTLIFLH